MKRLLFIALCFGLMGQSCDPKPPDPDDPKPVSAYCHGNDYSVMSNVEFGYEQDGVMGGLSAILMGDPSDTVLATVQVTFGGAYCTGVALGPKLVLTAGHCGYAPTTAHTVKVYERDGAPTEAPALEPDLRLASTATGLPTNDKEEETFAFNASVIDAAGGLKLVYSSVAASHVVHPDYMEYTRTNDFEARKSDLMLLHLSEPLPDELLVVAGPYHTGFAKFCNGLAAQGYGRHEGTGLDLRETKYIITKELQKHLRSRASDLPPGEDSGRICFGDSGGPLYADVGGVVYLAGITTTTMSQDCMAGGSHVRVSFYWDTWIAENWEAT
jgi:hypothetical protein